MLRKATISKRHPSSTMTPMKSGIFARKIVAKSAKIAVMPPTKIAVWLDVVAAGM